MEVRFKHLLIFVLIALCLGFLAGDRLRAYINRDRIDELGNQLNEQADRNRELEQLNSEHIETIRGINRKLDHARAELEEVRGVIDSISSGLGGDISTVSNIIVRIRSIREAVEEYQNRTDSSNGPGID